MCLQCEFMVYDERCKCPCEPYMKVETEEGDTVCYACNHYVISENSVGYEWVGDVL